MNILDLLKRHLKEITTLRDHLDTGAAATSIRSNIYFKGPTVWILAFSIVIASVGLNINSTAVIIGAMLISPLMGPIIGLGMAVGINDYELVGDAFRNLIIMVLVSLVVSFLYFLLSPLRLANPTELAARTSPTIYDVIIALFGGMAGILEQCRKEKGTVLSGVAIATALMPPLCTAGYGIAKGNSVFFLGAMLLFLINCVFIILATYILTKYLRFKEAEYTSPTAARKTRTLMTIAIIAVMVPSLWSATLMVMDNNFERNVRAFVADNKNFGQGYIYDYNITEGKDRKVEVFYAGRKLTSEEMEFLSESAVSHGIPAEKLQIRERDLGDSDKATDQLLKGIYERAEDEIQRKDLKIKDLENELSEIKGRDVNYRRLAREIRYSYPEVKDLSIAKGVQVDDSLRVKDRTVVIAESEKPIEPSRLRKVEEWLRLRMEDTTVVVHNINTNHE